MSKVYSFNHKKISNSKFTLKILLNIYNENTINIKKKFESEYKILLNENRLPKHNNIIQIYNEFIDVIPKNLLPNWNEENDIDEMEKSLFVIMPFYKKNLSQVITEHKNMHKDLNYNFLPFFQVLLWMEEINNGIWHLNKNFIIHRDLKPDNILLSHSNNIIVCDFGLCLDCIEEELDNYNYYFVSNDQVIAGAPSFKAPELSNIKKKSFINYEKTDIFSMVNI
jgi:serine/threonine protein kinase